MAAYRDLNITVVYSEGGAVSPRVRRAVSAGKVEPRRWLGCLTLLMAAVWLYATWFPARHFLASAHLEAMFSLPGLVDLSQVLGGIAAPPPELANPAQPKGRANNPPVAAPTKRPAVSAYQSDAKRAEPVDEQRARSKAIFGRLTIAMYTWLTTMTVVGCWLAMTGAAAVSGWLVSSDRARPVRLLATLTFLAVGLIAWKYWPRMGTDIPKFPVALQCAYALGFALFAGAACASTSRAESVWLFVIGLIGWVALAASFELFYQGRFPIRASQMFWFWAMVVAGLAGAAFLSRHLRGLSAVAIVLVLVSCGVTSIGLWYAHTNGGFVSYTPTAATYVKALVLQSLFAWVLLATRRTAR